MTPQNEIVLQKLMQEIREATFKHCQDGRCQCASHRQDYWAITQAAAARALRLLRGDE